MYSLIPENSFAPLRRETGFRSICYQTLKPLLKSEVVQISNKQKERYLFRMTKIKLGKSSDFYLQLHVSRLQ